MPTESEQQSFTLKVCSSILSIAILSTYVGYHPPISDFCINNITFTKINNVTIESPEIIDVHKMLGESGKVIQLYRAEGITIFSFIGGIIVVSICSQTNFAFLLTIALCICEVVFCIIFIDLYFQDVIPSQCVDSLMGNNFAYYIMQIKVILNIITLSIVALILSLVGCVVLNDKLSKKTTEEDEERNILSS